MDLTRLSDKYRVRRLTEEDRGDIYALLCKNTLYYRYCPPFVTEESVARDMSALPPGKTASDKYYVGYYAGEKLIAVLDLILRFPDDDTALIGFFMTDTAVQNTGVGSGIIDGLSAYLKRLGFTSVRLGWVKGNPQAAHFWKKNRFAETGETYETDRYTVVAAKRKL